MLFGAAAALREALGAPLPMPYHAVYYDQAVAGVRTALGDEACAASWAAGGVLPLEETIALALEGNSAT